MTKKHIDIEQYEKDILEDFEKGEFKSVANLEDEMELAKKAASNFMKRDSPAN